MALFRSPKKTALRVAGGLAAALPFALVSGRSSFGLALGDALVAEAVILFAWLWFAYLRRDGIRILPPSRRASPPESWKDRIPAPGSAPLPSRSIPGPDGPGSEEYARLSEAEESLRARIIGRDEEKKVQSDRKAETVAAAILLFIAGLLLEFVLPF
jgi:hypothetical protein